MTDSELVNTVKECSLCEQGFYTQYGIYLQVEFVRVSRMGCVLYVTQTVISTYFLLRKEMARTMLNTNFKGYVLKGEDGISV